MDGAGEFRIFWQVGLRLLGPGIVTVFLFALVAHWNNYFLPLIMLNSSEADLVDGWGSPQQRRRSAAGVRIARRCSPSIITGSLKPCSIIPLVIAFSSLQRYRNGIRTSGVKK